jgi:hypothetical protein
MPRVPLDRQKCDIKKGAKKPPAKECPLGLSFQDTNGVVYVVTETKTKTRRWSKKADSVSKANTKPKKKARKRSPNTRDGHRLPTLQRSVHWV